MGTGGENAVESEPPSSSRVWGMTVVCGVLIEPSVVPVPGHRPTPFAL
jgi:hypothetical protein